MHFWSLVVGIVVLGTGTACGEVSVVDYTVLTVTTHSLLAQQLCVCVCVCMRTCVLTQELAQVYPEVSYENYPHPTKQSE